MLYQLLFSWALFSTGWQSQGAIDGISVETRAMPGSGYDWFRVATDSDVPAAIQAEAIWGPAGPEGVVSSYVKEHRVLQDDPQTRLIYQTISAPMVADRDYVMRITRERGGDGYIIAFETVEDPRVPPRDGKVRMRILASCSVEPLATGGSRIVYELFSDIGGDVPPWMARSSQREASVAWLKTMLLRGERQHKLGPTGQTASN